MTTARRSHTATLLPSGKVLIASGYPDSNGFNPLLTSAELYDPATGTFTPTGSMAAQQTGAALRRNGKVAKVHPGKDYTQVMGSLTKLRDLAQRDLMYIEETARK